MFRWRIALVCVVLLTIQIGVVSSGSPEADSAGVAPFSFLTGIDGIHQSQVVLAPDGTMLLVWVQKGTEGLDLFAATRTGSGSFSAPLRINREPVNSYTGDEARPDVALGPDGAVAVAWTADDMNMMVAVGKDHGRSFSTPVRMNQDGGEAARTMPVVAFSSDGVVHAVWLDARNAPPRREEPANLYYARIEGGFGRPRRASPPLWEIGGCPSVGPVVLDGLTLWKDGSKGFWRLLSASDPGAEPATILKDREDELTLTYAPRRVSGSENLVLVGGRPGGFILKRHDTGWDIVSDDLPEWASSAALAGRRLVLVGNDEGRLRVEELRLEGSDG